MKLKEIIAIIQKRKQIGLYSVGDTQYLSDGTASYPLLNLPHLNKDNLQAIMNIPDDKWGQYNIVEDVPGFSHEDEEDYDIPITDMNITIGCSGMEMIPFTGGGRIFFIQFSYIKPFLNDKSNYQFFARKISRRKYITVVREGFFTRGFISPYEICDDNFIDDLNSIIVMTKERMDELKYAEQTYYQSEVTK